jgi:large subunit ribosomal protein L18
MLSELVKKRKLRQRRSLHVRKKIMGSAQRPRLCVRKTNSNIQVQLIDDELGVTLGSIATYAKEFRNTENSKKNKSSAKKLGERIAEIAKEKNIREVIFDRGSSKYHGILAELANAAREGGLQF